MGKRCIVQFCDNSNKTGHSTHVFPRDLNLRRQWIKFVQVKRADFVQPTKHSVICGAHFTSDCFKGVYMREMGFKKSTDLIPSAVPTIQLQTPQQKALSEVRKRTMGSEETEQTAGKYSENRQLKRSTRLGSKPRSCLTITKLNMSRTLLTSELTGLLAVPGTSIENASETEEKPMELTEPSENEDELLAGPDESDHEDFESS